MVKLSGVLVFISFIFIYSSTAQTTEKNNLSTGSEKPETNSFAESRRQINLGRNPFADAAANKRYFEDPSGEKQLDEQDAENEIGPRTFKLRRGEKEFNVEFGYSPFEPTHFAGEKEYNTAGRKVGLVAVRWGRVFGTAKGITWQYLFEAVPFLISLKNEVTNPAFVSEAATPGVRPTKRETSYGFGLTPAAFRFYFLPKSRWKPFAQLGAGFIYTNKPMPLPDTTRLNFAGYFGGGIMYQFERSRAVTFSYRYLHFSNANTANNPGYNANVFALGYSFFYQ